MVQRISKTFSDGRNRKIWSERRDWSKKKTYKIREHEREMNITFGAKLKKKMWKPESLETKRIHIWKQRWKTTDGKEREEQNKQCVDSEKRRESIH